MIVGDTYLIFNCPHCDMLLEVLKSQTNCCIFRHGVYKNGQQVDPHAKKVDCIRLVEERLIHGCGKPFQLMKNAQGAITTVVVCDYI